MNRPDRLIFGVVAAQMSDMEQTEILQGAINQAKVYNIDIAVISNIYNPVESSDVLEKENDIYDLILSDKFDGFIFFSESVLNSETQKKIIDKFKKLEKNIPVIAVGTPQADFFLDNFIFVNTSDEHDFEKITDHLIDVHGFTDIDMLSGFDFIEVSHQRVDGYRKSLEKHNIKYNEDKVCYGDFWIESGRLQAQKYINGERPFPQALVCANDYMAYAFLDELLKNNIPVPEKISVTGYEYVRERIYHYPVLTTFQRNRKGLGALAVRILYKKLTSGEYEDYELPEGTFISGNTCSCGICDKQLSDEQNDVSLKRTFDFLSLFGQIELKLTECRTINEFIHICREFRYMIRDTDELYICLYENWYEDNALSENVICYDIFFDKKPVTLNKYNFSKLFSGLAAFYNLSPVFFLDRTLGYVVAKCNSAAANNNMYKNWLKAISNAIEFLRMKNDIQYLSQCVNLSETHDIMTDMYNERGFKSAYDSFIKKSAGSQVHFILLKVCISDNTFSKTGSGEKISAIIAAADSIKKLCSICGRINDNTFAGIIKKDIPDSSIISEMLYSIIIRNKKYINSYGTDSFVCTSHICNCENSYHDEYANALDFIENKVKIIAERHTFAYYKKMIEIKNNIYIQPEKYFDSELSELSQYSKGHLRAVYKNCFGVNLYQDFINSRICLAEYLLFSSELNINEISMKCGYQDCKYFMRQFHNITGCTPNQFRKLFR